MLPPIRFQVVLRSAPHQLPSFARVCTGCRLNSNHSSEAPDGQRANAVVQNEQSITSWKSKRDCIFNICMSAACGCTDRLRRGLCGGSRVKAQKQKHR
jgi:hypothetical protein